MCFLIIFCFLIFLFFFFGEFFFPKFLKLNLKFFFKTIGLRLRLKLDLELFLIKLFFFFFFGLLILIKFFSFNFFDLIIFLLLFFSSNLSSSDKISLIIDCFCFSNSIIVSLLFELGRLFITDLLKLFSSIFSKCKFELFK